MTVMAGKSKKISTRESILNIAASEIHENGFRATGLNDILSKSGLTKGAFYHYFKSKAELGLAVINEVVSKRIDDLWIEPLRQTDAGIGSLRKTIEYAMAANNSKRASLGCPLCNLASEMSTQDEKICHAVASTMERWHSEIARVLKSDQQKGLIRANVDCEQSAYFILSSLQGAIGLAKPFHNSAPFRASLRGLLGYLESLEVQTV